MIQPPEYVSGIQPYIPGKPLEELERELGIKDSVKLASNENPAGPSPAALKAVIDSMPEINRYPDGSGYYLKKALSGMLSINEDEIILGNGSNELLDIAVRTFLKDDDEAIMAVPSFIVYSMAVQAVGAKSVQIPLKNYVHDLPAMTRALTSKTKIIFIANPNNPTGTINKRDEFEQLMSEITENILVVIDEAYLEYVSDPDYPDSIKHLNSGKNILILRTFSKIYGLAGLRLGYGIANTGIISDMNKLREPFNTNSIAQKAAIAALKDSNHIINSRVINETGKRYMYGELDYIGIKFVPTEANFIYIPIEKSISVYEKLLKNGVIIRPMGPNAIRVTIGLPEENKRFIEALKQIV